MNRRWYRFRWWLARRIAPRNVLALQVLHDDNRRDAHSCRLFSTPIHLWGNAYRFVTPLVAEKLDQARRQG